MNPHGYIIITQSPQFTLGFTLGNCTFYGSGKCIMTRTHDYVIMQSNFTALKSYFAFLIHPSSPPPPTSGNPLILYYVHTFLPFSQCHTVRIIQYIANFLLKILSFHRNFLLWGIIYSLGIGLRLQLG